MLYLKNLPTWERVGRVIAGVLAAAIGWFSVGGVAGVSLALAAAGIVVSGLAGFCPMCALAGRRLDKVKHNGPV
ncbi:MAG: DUF2892 domain-containing protein [Pseudomonadota bacterium]